MNGSILGFEWDDGNLEHCRKHGLSRTEIEELFASPVVVLPDTGHSEVEIRHRAIGRTRHGRAVFVVFTIRERGGQRYIRPIGARYMHKDEIESYEKENPDL
jgi:uncharacterized DUF497 family protein